MTNPLNIIKWLSGLKYNYIDFMFSNRGLERYLRKQDYLIFSKIFFKLEKIINAK
jgi:hypothetical protein